MKVKFSQRLNTRLSVMPVFFILFFLIAGGIGFYVFGYPFLKDFHKSHLINLSSEKRAVIDAWFEDYRSDLEDLSKSSVVRDSAAVLTSIQPSGKYKKKIAEQINEAQINISGLFGEKVLSDKYKMLSLLSKDGRVISSSKHEIAGEDWSDRDFFRDMVPGLKSPNIIGFQEDGSDYIMGFLSPIFDANGEMAAIIYAEVDVKGLADILKIEKNLYKSEKIELIDKDGNIVLTKEGTPVKKFRYNIPADSGENIVIHRDGLFFNVVSLKKSPLQIICTVDKSEVAKPFNILLIAYSSFAGVVILLIVIQNAYLAPKLITKPVLRLVNTIKSIARGNLDIDIQKGFRGELLELKKSLSNMIEELTNRESNLREDIRVHEKSRLKSMLFAKVSNELRNPLNSIVSNMEIVLDRDGTSLHRKNIVEVLNASKDIQHLLNDLYDLSMLESGMLAVSPEEFYMCELLKEVENGVRGLAGTKEIELIVDCQDAFVNATVYTDRHRLKQILANLLKNAIKSTNIGTVTMLASRVVSGGVEYIEVSVADTGKGIDSGNTEQIFDEFSPLSASIGLAIAKKLTDVLGGRIEAESISGRGSIFTVTIPVKAIVYK